MFQFLLFWKIASYEWSATDDDDDDDDEERVSLFVETIWSGYIRTYAHAQTERRVVNQLPSKNLR